MKFKIDIRFIAIQMLLCVGGWLIGVIIVSLFLDLGDPKGFIAKRFAAGIAMYCLFNFPRKIVVDDETITFTEEGALEKKKVELKDISSVETKCKLYNTLTITTTSGKKHSMHPKDVEALREVLEQHI